VAGHHELQGELWGLSACDGPGDFTHPYRGQERTFFGYAARGPIDEPCEEARRQGNRIDLFVGPLARRLRGLTFQPSVWDKRCDSDREATRLQMSRDDVSVSAIVSRPAQDRHAARLEARPDPLRDGAAGIFHQGQTGKTAGYGQAVSFGHLGIGEDLDHCTGTISERLIARTPHNALLARLTLTTF